MTLRDLIVCTPVTACGHSRDLIVCCSRSHDVGNQILPPPLIMGSCGSHPNWRVPSSTAAAPTQTLPDASSAKSHVGSSLESNEAQKDQSDETANPLRFLSNTGEDGSGHRLPLQGVSVQESQNKTPNYGPHVGVASMLQDAKSESARK